MEYPKKIMSISELIELGYTRNMLRDFVHIPGQRFAFKTQGGGKWMFDVEAFEKFLKRNGRVMSF